LSHETAVACFERTNELLGLKIDYHFCPHQSNPPVCYCRKPQSGNAVLLIEKYKLNPAECIFVGDQTSDKTFAARAGFKYFHVDQFFGVK
jgi:histidinol phosphatase-like enzyme